LFPQTGRRVRHLGDPNLYKSCVPCPCAYLRSSRSTDHDPHRTIYYLGYPIGGFAGLKHRQLARQVGVIITTERIRRTNTRSIYAAHGCCILQLDEFLSTRILSVRMQAQLVEDQVQSTDKQPQLANARLSASCNSNKRFKLLGPYPTRRKFRNCDGIQRNINGLCMLV
jgi:hypothetical protein